MRLSPTIRSQADGRYRAGGLMELLIERHRNFSKLTPTGPALSWGHSYMVLDSLLINRLERFGTVRAST